MISGNINAIIGATLLAVFSIIMGLCFTSFFDYKEDDEINIEELY